MGVCVLNGYRDAAAMAIFADGHAMPIRAWVGVHVLVPGTRLAGARRAMTATLADHRLRAL